MKQTIEIGAYEAKTKFAELLDAVERGAEVVVTRRGVPVARLSRAGDRPRKNTEAVDRWLEVRHRVKPLGMTMKEAVELGRKY